jgi:hypothetical protein
VERSSKQGTTTPDQAEDDEVVDEAVEVEDEDESSIAQADQQTLEQLYT